MPKFRGNVMPLFSMSRIQLLPLPWSLSNTRLHTVSSIAFL